MSHTRVDQMDDMPPLQLMTFRAFASSIYALMSGPVFWVLGALSFLYAFTLTLVVPDNSVRGAVLFLSSLVLFNCLVMPCAWQSTHRESYLSAIKQLTSRAFYTLLISFVVFGVLVAGCTTLGSRGGDTGNNPPGYDTTTDDSY
jgi:hypothetical protein